MSIECFLITKWENDHIVLVWEGEEAAHTGEEQNLQDFNLQGKEDWSFWPLCICNVWNNLYALFFLILTPTL